MEFSGVLDENSNHEKIGSALNGIPQNLEIQLDFSKVLYANSIGIMTWLKLEYIHAISV